MTDHAAFLGNRKLASGTLVEVALAAKPEIDRGRPSTSSTARASRWTSTSGERGGCAHAPHAAGAGRSAARAGASKLGVVAREVTLLPRHWEWLARQPGGASVALRKLVEDARRLNEDKDRARIAREVAYRFMSAMAGNLANFEEATRALFAGDGQRFSAMIEWWPQDIRAHLEALAADGLG